METVLKLHGTPNIIVSVKDLIFTGKFWTELFSYLGNQLAPSSSYHPQFDGQTEIVKKFLEIDQFQSISLNGETYLVKIQHG